MATLTGQEKELLRIEAKVWPKSGPKATAIREATGLTPIAAAQIINRIIETEAALVFDPLTTKRLLRRRAQRQRSRRTAGRD